MFGFLNLKGGAGNCGLLDAAMALRWVRDEISRFGGDCNNAGFNLSVGCFGTTLSKIAPNGQIWEFMGSRMDHSAPNYVARLFLCQKN